jgi:hypothetical protein
LFSFLFFPCFPLLSRCPFWKNENHHR